MSHIGKSKIILPDHVNILVTNYDLNYNLVSATGKLGTLSAKIHNKINICVNDKIVSLSPCSDSKYYNALWGLSRTLINNIIVGVHQGYTYKLSIVGVGYRAVIDNKNLILKVGYSHDIVYQIPSDIKVSLINPTTIEIKGIDKQLVTSVCSLIRAFKKPDPYKGKGIRFYREIIPVKQGKRG